MSIFHHRTLDVAGIYDRHANMLYRLALSYLHHAEDAQDAVQDVFEKLMDHEPRFRDEDHERAWLVKATVNRSCDLLRRRSVRTSLPLEEAHHLSAGDSDPAQEVLDTLSKVPEGYRSVITLHHLEGFSVEEVGKILGLSQSAVKMRLKRGREALKMQFEEENHV